MAEAEQELVNAERETRQTFADLLSDLINSRKSINSYLRKVARKNDAASPTNETLARYRKFSGRAREEAYHPSIDSVGNEY